MFNTTTRQCEKVADLNYKFNQTKSSCVQSGKNNVVALVKVGKEAHIKGALSISVKQEYYSYIVSWKNGASDLTILDRFEKWNHTKNLL